MNYKRIQAMAEEQPDKGQLQIQVTSEQQNIPIEDATIDISYSGDPEEILEQIRTNQNGQTETLELNAPPLEYSMEPSENQPYSEYTLKITAAGYETLTISGTEILPLQTALQNIRMRSLAVNNPPDVIVIPAHTLYGEYPPKIAEAEIKPITQTGEIVLNKVVIPEYIVVHDGSPMDSTATNHYVKYRDYIKNVASSEIYATWPKSTIIANILAIQSFTLNRVYTEWYRNKGYNFTITSSTAFDQKWMRGRNYYASIEEAVDEVFDNYLSRPNVKQPILTQYCDGQRVSCPNWMTILQGRSNNTFNRKKLVHFLIAAYVRLLFFIL
ncbi:MAG: SpoIID/LytB domain-containing protein [Lachnospiraceae bacterium]|nr:SpoIID/LytB domain-containing protein [Lachnospiraceae bacterium]